MFDWHIAGVLQRGGNWQVAFMRQLHERAFSGAQWSRRLLWVAEQCLPTSCTELIHQAWYCETASVCSSTYFQQIYQLTHCLPLYSSVALCMNSISDSLQLTLRVSRLALLGTNVLYLPPLQHLATYTKSCRAALESMIFHYLMNMQVFLFAGPFPILLFSAPASLITVFMMCSGGERPATPLHWVALNEEKKKGRKILPGTSPNEQINASVPQEMGRLKKREKLLGL